MGSSLYLKRTEKKFSADTNDRTLSNLRQDIGNYVPPQEFTPGQPVTLYNTIYFDSEDGVLLNNELSDRYNTVRIRVRQYEYEHMNTESPYWFECKIREGDVRKKRRLKLDHDSLGRFVAGEEISETVLESNAPQTEPDACRSLYDELQQIIQKHNLEPTLLVRYKRTAFEGITERVSVDWDILYNRINRSILSAGSLKDYPVAPVGGERSAVLEFKYTASPPACLDVLRKKYRLREEPVFSKFLGGMKSLLESPLGDDNQSNTVLRELSDSPAG